MTSYESYDDYDNFDEVDEEIDGDLFDDEFTDVAPCPICGEEIPADSEKCHHCGYWITHSTRPKLSRGILIAIFIIALIIIIGLIFYLIPVIRQNSITDYNFAS